MGELCFLEVGFNPDRLILYQAEYRFAGQRVFAHLQFHITDNAGGRRADGGGL